MALVKTIAIIGAGPAGAITVDALAQEKAFDVIKVFERRESAGGCWSVTSSFNIKFDCGSGLHASKYHCSIEWLTFIHRLEDPPNHELQLLDLEKIANRNADTPLPIPSELPTTAPKSAQYRFSDTSIYPYLETNIDALAMSFSQELIPEIRSEWSISRHGKDTPFRPWKVIEKYISEDLLNRNGYQDFVTYNTTVELVSKVQKTGKWRLFLRKSEPESKEDFWWCA